MKDKSYIEFNVYSIQLKDNDTLIIDYDVTPSDNRPLRNRLSCNELPREEFSKLLKKTEELYGRMLGFPLADKLTGEGLLPCLNKIIFKHKNVGETVKFSGWLLGISIHRGIMKLTTPEFNIPKIAEYNELSAVPGDLTLDDLKLLAELKDAAFRYAYLGERLQPTLDEAAEEYRTNGMLQKLS